MSLGTASWSPLQSPEDPLPLIPSVVGLQDEAEFIEFCDRFLPDDEEEFNQVTDLWEVQHVLSCWI